MELKRKKIHFKMKQSNAIISDMLSQALTHPLSQTANLSIHWVQHKQKCKRFCISHKYIRTTFVKNYDVHNDCYSV